MIGRLPLTLVLYLSVATKFTTGEPYHWPSPQYDALERLIYEGNRGDGSNLASIVHPCRKRPTTNASIGAEWLRIAFHDMSTHNADDGSGGLDGSIAYELDRSENFGSGFNQTLDDFLGFPNQYISRADVIALGAVFAVSSCGGPVIPYRGGRSDVYVGGGRGVPEPQHDLANLTESFRRQGFNQTEMIKLVACGHSIGGVRSADFPELVAPGPNPATPNIADFDTTTQFDNVVVTQYLDGTTQNALVVSSNATMNSDLRVFTSDGNATMHSLSSSDAYNSECQSLLERMINVVPSNVSLTDEITLLPAKLDDTQLTIEKNQLVFKTALRLTQAINGTVNSQRTVRMLWCDKNGDTKDCNKATRSAASVSTVKDSPNNSPVTLSLGLYFIHYAFVVPIDSSASISKFWFEVDEHDGSKPTVYNNGGDNYIFPQDQVIFVPTLSHVESRSDTPYTKDYTNRIEESFTKIYTIVVGVRNDSNPSRVYLDAHDHAISGFPQPLNTTIDLKANSSITPVGGYTFYTAEVDDVGQQLTLDLHADIGGNTYTDNFRQTTFLDNTPYTAPSNVSSSSGSGSSTNAGNRVGVWNVDGTIFTVMGTILGLAVLMNTCL